MAMSLRPSTRGGAGGSGSGRYTDDPTRSTSLSQPAGPVPPPQARANSSASRAAVAATPPLAPAPLPVSMAQEAASARKWAAAVVQARTCGADTAAGIEELLRELMAGLAVVEAELEARQREAECAKESCSAEEVRLLAIDDRIGVLRTGRLEATKKLHRFTKLSASEVKTLKNRPPRNVRRGIEAVYTVLQCHTWAGSSGEYPLKLDFTCEWAKIQRMLSNNDFVQSVLEFDVRVLDLVPQVAEFVVSKYFPALRAECGGGGSNGGAQSLASPASLRSATGAATPRNVAADVGGSEGAGPDATANELAASTSCAPKRSGETSPLLPTTPAQKLQSLPLKLEKSPIAMATTAAALPSIAAGAELSGRARNRGISAQRNAGAASMAAARLLKTTAPRKSIVEVNLEPLDVAAVEYASRACGALVRWVSEVLHEFVAMRELRTQQDVCMERLKAVTVCHRNLEDTCDQLQEEKGAVLSELDNWRARLMQLRAAEIEVDRAHAGLAQLARLEERCSQGGRCGDTTLLLSRGGNGGHLKGLPTAGGGCPESAEVAPNWKELLQGLRPNIGGAAAGAGPRSVSMVELPPQVAPEARLAPSRPAGDEASGTWPPKGRKYLHVLSAPKLATYAHDEEADESSR